MATPKNAGMPMQAEPIALRDHIVRLFGDLGDDGVSAILALRPTEGELQEAHAWLEGQGSAMARSGHPQTPAVAAILDIAADVAEEDGEQDHAH